MIIVIGVVLDQYVQHFRVIYHYENGAKNERNTMKFR